MRPRTQIALPEPKGSEFETFDTAGRLSTGDVYGCDSGQVWRRRLPSGAYVVYRRVKVPKVLL
jgi:hypothetical protein